VDEAMMMPTQQDEIVEVGGTTIGPVLDVMNLQPSRVAAAGELASATVPVIDNASQPSGDDPGVSANSHDGLPIMNDGLENTLASQPSGGLVWHQDSVWELGDALVLGGEAFEICV
jgi:hypothetical protein